MSTLVIEEITVIAIEQEIRLTRNAGLVAIRLHLMKYGTPTGDLVMAIYEGANLIKSVTTAMSTLNAEFSLAYGHGLFKFDLEIPIRKSGAYTTYTIKLSAAGYGASNYYAWVKDWLPEKTNLYGEGNITNGITPQDTLKPYHFELYEYN